jgi:hypothetical protein
VTEIEGLPRGGPEGAVRLSTEGVDLLTLAGVNDANLVELRASPAPASPSRRGADAERNRRQLERAGPIAERMVTLARQRVALTPDDVLRISLDPRAPGARARVTAGRDGPRDGATAATGSAGPRSPARAPRGGWRSPASAG